MTLNPHAPVPKEESDRCPSTAFRSRSFFDRRGKDNRLFMHDIEAKRLVGVPQGNAREHHPWYAVRVRVKFETVASVILREKGFEEFLPLYRAKRQWSDRIKQLDLPLFPVTNAIRPSGKNLKMNQTPCCCCARTISIMLSVPVPLAFMLVIKIAETTARPMATSYDTICALDRSAPING